jgi:chromosome segregation ATPase
MKQVAERKTGRLFAELQKLEQRAADQQDRLNNLQNQIFKGNERMDQYKLEMNWNQEELEQWALASRQKEEDFLTLEKYKRADDSKIKELTLHIEKLTIDVKKNQEELEREVTKT